MFSLDPTTVALLVVAGVVGVVGLYTVLPHRLGQGKPGATHALGAALSIGALLLLGSFWVGPPATLDRLFFYAFGGLSLAAGVLMISSRDPVNSALWFAVVILSTSGLLLLAGGQFLAAGTVIVYAGAIIVTFLFVIMLAQSHGRAHYDRSSRSPLMASLSSMLMLLGVSVCILSTRTGPEPVLTVPPIERRIVPAQDLRRLTNAPPTASLSIAVDSAVPATARLPRPEREGRPAPHVPSLGATLWVDHLPTVEVVGVILFIALIGACSYATGRLATKNAARVTPTQVDASAPVATRT